MEKNLKLSKLERGELVNNTSYRELIGSLIYLKTTCPDLSYEIIILSSFMQEPREIHWNATKWVLRYIQGTKYYGLLYKKNTKFVLVGYLDAYFVGSVDDRASTSGYLMNMGSTTISWSYKKQATIENSPTKA
jgi:hypothetical protein